MLDFNIGDIGNLFTSAREAITGKKILDPTEMAEIEFKLSQLEHLANQGQIDINKIEAASDNLFVAGWRPFIGWVCGIAIAYAFVGQPIIEWIVTVSDITRDVKLDDGSIIKVAINTPELDVDTLYQLVLAMLGMATLRTYEKKNSVSREK